VKYAGKTLTEVVSFAGVLLLICVIPRAEESVPEEKAFNIPVCLLVPENAAGKPVLASGSVAFPKGMVKGGRLQLSADGKLFPGTVAVRSLWPDGSVMVAGIEACVPAEKTVAAWSVTRPTEGAEQGTTERVQFTTEDTENGRAIVVKAAGHGFRLPGKGALPFLAIDGSNEAEAFAEISVLSKAGELNRFSTSKAPEFDNTRVYSSPDGLSLQVVRRGFMRAAVGGFDLPNEPLLVAPYGSGEGIAVVWDGGMKTYGVEGGLKERNIGGDKGKITAAAIDNSSERIWVAIAGHEGATIEAVNPSAPSEPTAKPVEINLAPTRLAAFKGVVVALDKEGGITAVEGQTGKVLWSAKVSGKVMELTAGGTVFVLVEEEGKLKSYSYGLVDGKEAGKTTYWDYEPPYAISADARFIAHRKGDGFVVLDAVSGDFISGGKSVPVAMAFSPAGRVLAVQTSETPDKETGKNALVALLFREEKVLFAQEVKEGFRASKIALDDQARVLATWGGGVLSVADTGGWPYRTVYRFWAGAPVVEVEHALFLDGDPDTEFLASAELGIAAPVAKQPAVRTLAPMKEEQSAELIYRGAGGDIYVADDDFRTRQPRGVRTEDGKLVYELYPAAVKRPVDLRRYALHVFTDHLYDESPGWGSRSGQGTGLFTSFRVGFAEAGREPVRGYFVTDAKAAAASLVWGEFMSSDEAGQKYPVLSRFNERFLSIVTYTAGRDGSAIDYGDFPNSPFLGDFLFQGDHGWKNGENGVLQALVAQFIYKPDYARLRLMQKVARHICTVDMLRFADGAGDYWRAGADSAGTVKSSGSQHWSGRAGDVRQIGNAAGLLDYYLLTGDYVARDAADEAIGFGMRAKGARFEVLSLFDLAACIAGTESDMDTAAKMHDYAQGTIKEMPPAYRGLLAATYICPQIFRHQALWSDAAAAELISGLSPAQGGAYPENLLNRTMYWMLTSDRRAQTDVQRYAGVLARLPIASDAELGDDYVSKIDGLRKLYPFLVEKGFPILNAMPYMMKALDRFNIKEEELVR
jgi:hypothetical protein